MKNSSYELVHCSETCTVPNLMGFRSGHKVRCLFGQVLEVVWPRKLAGIETSGSADDVQKGVVLGRC